MVDEEYELKIKRIQEARNIKPYSDYQDAIKMKKINLEQGSQEWLEYRKSKFNASETSALFGCGFVSKFELAKIKFENKEQYQSEKMKAGQQVEKLVRSIAQDINGCKFTPCVCVWEEDERFSASLDGINDKGDVVLECKYSQYEKEYVGENSKPTEKYYLQVQHQLMVSGADMCLFIAMGDNGEYEYCYVYPDKKTQEEIVKAWSKFIKDYENGEFSQPLPPSLEPKCNELREIMAKKKELELKEKELKSEIQDEAYLLYGDGLQKAVGYGVTISKVVTNRQDYKGFLKSKNLEVSDEFISENVSYRIGIEK